MHHQEEKSSYIQKVALRLFFYFTQFGTYFLLPYHIIKIVNYII